MLALNPAQLLKTYFKQSYEFGQYGGVVSRDPKDMWVNWPEHWF